MSELARKSSAIWKHFKIVNSEKAKCEYCSKMISYSGGGTGNLNRHMKKIHWTVAIEQPLVPQMNIVNPVAETTPESTSTSSSQTCQASCSYSNSAEPTSSSSSTSLFRRPVAQPPVQTTIDGFARSTRPLPIGKSKQLDEPIVKFIVKGFHPFSIVEELEFKNMHKMIQPSYTLPTRKTISSSLIPRIHQTTKEKVQEVIREADAICLTTDGWTSLNNVSYIALTAHFITKETQLKSVLLGCTDFHERHTAENLSNFLMTEATKWGISHKISGIITDNAANIVAAVHTNNWRHFPCFAHTLNLVVQNSLDALKEQIDKVKAIVQYFKHSSSACSKLASIQKQMNLPPLKLKQNVITRWNSTYDMVERLVKIKDAVLSALAIEQPRLNTLSPDDWVLLQKSMEVLRLFNEVTIEMSAEKSVSISKVMVLVKIIKNHVERAIQNNGPDQYLRFLHILRDQLINRFGDMENNPLVTDAALLDPRFKKHGFLSRDKYDICLRSIKSKLRALIVAEDNVPEMSEQLPHASNNAESLNVWAEFDQEVEKDIIRNPTAASIIEIDKYLNEPLIKRTDDPLQWWHERKLLYPNLYILMKRRLCVPATSVPCERVFTKAGQVLNTKRSSLKPEKASQILFLNYNWT
ncbi:E3 SUMO-protein ligase ZBED1-like [Coccinella septempunctata]|uniref:E3 SUMO-protein ligase ZBED1-like n=1 Tax=Coccinella septempunctata TaxID=41139 RepID=UPI001D0611AE|nr:E3 SUMO-protein ligase ZBED1-like [Coccinella septempunctata]